MTLHSYGLPEKPHRIDENAFVFGAKGSIIYGCMDAIWSTEPCFVAIFNVESDKVFLVYYDILPMKMVSFKY